MSKKEKKEAEKAPEPAKDKAKEEKPTETAPKVEAKPEKAKPEKKRKPDKKIHTLYRVEGDKVARLLPVCERCGTGYFMADHGNRYTCGHCGFTRYKHAENEHV